MDDTISGIRQRRCVDRLRSHSAKGGVVSLTYELAAELWSKAITVNAIAPFAATRRGEGMAERHAAQLAKGILNEQRLKALEPRGDPAMVSPIVVYLASEHAAQVTGCVFRAGGGKIGLYSHPAESRIIFRDEGGTGAWPVEELMDLLPRTVLAGVTKPPHIQ